ncbi:L-alanine-DL-glutamate epimerase [Monaibacterium marinum]|uniref:Dipeptide epimerase n=1 Tax=Pontivivens marinum TaxID=1690039 RepID=A0A2C9CMT0_9RHOB|nr:N-acetyl-D-Glu racemase DgcA [Monaibacterium marinum]SOH92527.1 L-alanine-DL-glutamate epimerase [Monaibacterium marinum]
MIKAYEESFRLAEVFTISRGSRTEAKIVTVEMHRDGAVGRGECVPYARYGETIESVLAQIRSLPQDIDQAALQDALPSGAARNAVDCAMWDLRAKQAGRPAWELAGIEEPQPVTTAFTLSIAEPSAMQASAAKNAHRPLLKTKLGGGPDDLARIRAVRAGAPDARIIVDANEGWTAEQYRELAPQLVALGVELVEQPFPAGEDDALLHLDRLLPVCADESCHDRTSLAGLHGKYDMVNIKLDKTGGLTEALALHDAARAAGFRVMVGCMVGSSLAMAPAVLVAQNAEIVDLDGPLLLAEDRNPPLEFIGAEVQSPRPELWG